MRYEVYIKKDCIGCSDVLKKLVQKKIEHTIIHLSEQQLNSFYFKSQVQFPILVRINDDGTKQLVPIEKVVLNEG